MPRCGLDKFTMQSSILFTSFSRNIHTVHIMYKEGISMHKNGFAMAFTNLSFILRAFRLFVLFVRGKRMFVLLINLASLHSTEKTVESFKEFGFEYSSGLWSSYRYSWYCLFQSIPTLKS